MKDLLAKVGGFLLEPRTPWTEMQLLLGVAIAVLLLPLGLWLFRRQIDPGRWGPPSRQLHPE